MSVKLLADKIKNTEKSHRESKKFRYAVIMAVILGTPLWIGVIGNCTVYEVGSPYVPVMGPTEVMAFIGARSGLFTAYLGWQASVDAKQRVAQAQAMSVIAAKEDPPVPRQ